MRIITWVLSIIKGEIRRRPRFTTRPRLWQDTNWPDATLVTWRTTAASAGDFGAMHNLLAALWNGHISRESIDSQTSTSIAIQDE